VESEGKGVTIMEGIYTNIEFVDSVITFLGAVALLALAIGAVLFGYMAEEEKAGRKLYWAAEPVPGTEEEVLHEEEEPIRLAA